MEPVIRSVSSTISEGSNVARLITLDDNPPTCTLTYSRIPPGETSAHHIHPWEHEVFIIEGSGTLFCDDKEYPVKSGDAMFIPPNVDHYTLNNGGPGDILRIEINPLEAARSGGAQNNGGKGTGEPPVIRNQTALDRSAGHVLLGLPEGVLNYVMLHNDPMEPGAVSHPETGGHTHEWEHVIYVLEGSGTLVCDGKSYTVSQGDAVLVPPKVLHQWRNETQSRMVRVTYNPVASVGAEH